MHMQNLSLFRHLLAECIELELTSVWTGTPCFSLLLLDVLYWLVMLQWDVRLLTHLQDACG